MPPEDQLEQGKYKNFLRLIVSHSQHSCLKACIFTGLTISLELLLKLFGSSHSKYSLLKKKPVAAFARLVFLSSAQKRRLSNVISFPEIREREREKSKTFIFLTKMSIFDIVGNRLIYLSDDVLHENEIGEKVK